MYVLAHAHVQDPPLWNSTPPRKDTGKDEGTNMAETNKDCEMSNQGHELGAAKAVAPATPSNQPHPQEPVDFSFKLLSTGEGNQAKAKAGYCVLKRTNPFSMDISPSPLRQKTQKGSAFESLSTQSKAQQHISNAQQELLEAAMSLQEDREEQARLMELLGIFQAYTDRKALSTKTKMEKQLSMLENTVRSLAKAQKHPQNTSKNPHESQTTAALKDDQTAPKTSQFQGKSKATSYAAIVSSPEKSKPTQRPTPNKGQWTTVQKRRTQPAMKPCRLVLSLAQKDTPVDPLKARNQVNQAYTQKGYQGPITTSISKSAKNNLVLTFQSAAAKDFAQAHLDVLHPIVGIDRVLEDSTWYKVVAHGISTADFKENGPQMVKEEVEAFNQGLKVVSTPLWLTSEARRQSQQGGSMLLAFATEAEATQAVRSRLWIGAQSVRVEHAKDKDIDRQTKGAQNTSTC